MAIVWSVTPENAFGDLADAYAKAIYPAVRDIVEGYVPIAQAYMNDSIPWHADGQPDTDIDEPNDMYAWVEGMVNRTLILYLGHDKMAVPEKTLEKELAFAPPAMDYFGPLIMRDVRALLGSK